MRDHPDNSPTTELGQAESLDRTLRRLRHAGPPPELRDRTLRAVRRTLDGRQAQPHGFRPARAWEMTVAAAVLAILLVWPWTGRAPISPNRPTQDAASLADALSLDPALTRYVESRASLGEHVAASATESQSFHPLHKELDLP